MSLGEKSGVAPTLQTVAAEAGVATSTVSRYVKGQLQLAEDTERRVRQAMSTLGYEMPEPHRELSQRTTQQSIAILVPELDSYYSRFSRLAVSAAEQVGLIPLVVSVGLTSVQAASYLRALVSSGLAGVISIGTLRSAEARTLLASRGIPLVTIDERENDGPPPAHRILVDNYSGSRQVVAYLTRLGHERIAFISGPREHWAVADRWRGYEDAMRAADLDPSTQFDIEGVCSEAFGFGALTSLLSSPGPRPSAVFVASDEIAVGLLAAAEQLRVRVPEDLTVVGFDDIAAARLVVPSLSTVTVPMEMMAEAALSALFEVLAENKLEVAGTTVLPVSLVVRDSSGPPTAG